MSVPPDILILRDPRESVKKCSLTPLRGRPGVRFEAYDRERRVDAGGRIFLTPDGPELTREDRGRDLFLIDCSWRRVPALLATVHTCDNLLHLPTWESAEELAEGMAASVKYGGGFGTH